MATSAHAAASRSGILGNDGPDASRLGIARRADSGHNVLMHPALQALATLAILVPATLPAQGLNLDKSGGAIGGTVTAHVLGQPNDTYMVLFDLIEQTTPIPAMGITLEITTAFAGSTFVLPGWFGLTNAQGEASASVTLPNLPGLAGLRISLQAIGGDDPFYVSNLVRITPQVAGTFADALESPLAPILGGAIVDEGDGEFLFAGGAGPVAQRYSERLEQWTPAGATFGVGLLGQSTGLPDGRVLFTGGLDLATGQATDTAAIYDPQTQQTTTLQLGTPRAGHGASVTGNGKVLITGGLSSFDLQNPLSLFTGIENTTEFFDPATNTFAPGPTLLEARALHTSTTLTSGKVLIAGGLSVLPFVNLPTVSSTAYLFDPQSGSFGFPALFSGGRLMHSATALDNGKVLIAGGITLDLTTFLQTLQIQDIIIGTQDDCLVYTPGFLGFGSFATVPGLQEGRASPAIAPLPGGGALIAGGFQLTFDIPNAVFLLNATSSVDEFTANPNTLSPTGAMASARAFAQAQALPDGTVLVVGGGLGSAEIYQR